MSRTQRLALFYLLPACILAASPMIAAGQKPERIALWSGRAPVDENESEDANAFITICRPAKSNGTAIIICPGGGYGGLVRGPEGTGIAQWLTRHGVAGIVLEYRLPRGKPYRPLYDAQRAIRTVRANARKWKLNPRRIGIMGFSAGGHLASTAATHFDEGDSRSADPINRLSCRPDFAILIYPVITMGPRTHGGSRRNLLGRQPTSEMLELFSNEKRVTSRTPPMFLAHAADDRLVPPDNSRMLYDALRSRKIPARSLELPRGGHGLNGYKGPMWEAWKTQSLQWLEAQRTASADTPSGAEWIDLFNGTDLTGWEGDPGIWRVKDGYILGDGACTDHKGYKSYLINRSHVFKDFILEAEFNMSAGNSGVNYRCHDYDRDPKKLYEVSGYQADIAGGGLWDIYTTSTKRRYRVERASSCSVKRNSWNTMRIVANGRKISHEFNGAKCLEFVDNDTHGGFREAGFIALEFHDNGTRIRFRNIRVRILGQPAAARPQR